MESERNTVTSFIGIMFDVCFYPLKTRQIIIALAHHSLASVMLCCPMPVSAVDQAAHTTDLHLVSGSS